MNTIYNMVLVRHGGELGVKSKKTRSRMINILNATIRNAIREMGSTNVVNKYTRTLISGKENFDPEKVAQYLSFYISGIDSTSPVYFIQTLEIDQIVEHALKYTKFFLRAGKSFGFKVRRTGNTSFSSMELAKILGEKVSEFHDGIVDLSTPDFMFNVEVKYDYCFFYHIKFDGINGLPKGTQGKVLANIRPWSFDFLAACLMQRRGATIQPLIFKTSVWSELDNIIAYFFKFIGGKRTQNRFIIDLEENFLIKWSETMSSEQLCQACHFFTEKCSRNLFSKSTGMLGVVSGINFEDVSPPFYKELELGPEISVHRPTVMINENVLPQPFKTIFLHRSSNQACCSLQTRREYSEKLLLSDKAIKEIFLLADKVIEEIGSKIANSGSHEFN